MSQSWWEHKRRVSVVTDTEGWFDPFAWALVDLTRVGGDEASFFRNQEDVPEGDVAFYLSCMKLTPDRVLQRNRVNLVAHASDLPKGRGFSPVVWQILEGQSEIPITLFEMDGTADTGPVVATIRFPLEGHELNDEIRDILGRKIVELCTAYLNSDTRPVSVPQVGDPTWYPRRSPADSEIDPTRSIAEQFQNFRVADNERYPVFFHHQGHKYILKITKA